MSRILEMLAARHPNMDAIAARLDEVGAVERLAEVRAMGKREQAKLFELAQGRGKVDLDYMVPPSVAPLTEVIHEGKNSLPCFSVFQKRFCRLPQDPMSLGGYNEQALRPVTGPGYFVAREQGDELAIDYTRLPREAPTGWPPIVPQEARLGRFVYAGMVDVLRRVSQHVTIGRAIRQGKPTENYFLLCRRDP